MAQHRIVFMGTGDIALPAFSSLSVENLVGLVTQPDKPVGRKQIMTPPKIKELAMEKNIPVYQPEKVSDAAFLSELKALQPDVIVVMAYGQILSQALLDMPKVACINLHTSLLPKYRGAACIQAAIDAGDSHTGITVMHVVKALDAGDIILKHETEILPDETGGQLHDRLAEMSPLALSEALEQLENGTAQRIPQDENLVSYIPKLMRNDGEIDWVMPAAEVERRVRAYEPWPGTSTAFTEKKGKRQGRKKRLKVFAPVKILDLQGASGEVLECANKIIIACGERAIEIENLQPEGSRRMTASDFLLSSPLEKGELLG